MGWFKTGHAAGLLNRDFAECRLSPLAARH